MSRSSAAKKEFKTRPDSKGRITLGTLAKGVSSYLVRPESDGRVILEPMVEIPARESWLHENKAALKSVRKGLEQASAGELKSLGSFAKYADEKDDE